MRMHAALRHLRIDDPTDPSASFPAIVSYPTHARSTGCQVGPYRFDATVDAPLAAGRWPVIVISHGGGGSHLSYRALATHLASRGHLVVCPEHPGDRRDRSIAIGDADAVAADARAADAAAAHRPRHASLAIDAVLDDTVFAASADPSRIAAIGHSMGGCTALALVGGRPWSRSGTAIDVHADSRVAAAILLAPSIDWFDAPGALDAVSTPLLVMVGDQDRVTPAARIREVLGRLPRRTPLTWQTVAGAGHFAFLSAFPPPLQRPDFPPSVDPVGFDRARFHETHPLDVQRFVERAFDRDGPSCKSADRIGAPAASGPRD